MDAEKPAMIGALVQQHLHKLEQVITNLSEVLSKRSVLLCSQKSHAAKPT